MSPLNAGSVVSAKDSSNDNVARLCDSGMPDYDVCDVILTPSVQKDIISEAWSRGYAPVRSVVLIFGLQETYLQSSPLSVQDSCPVCRSNIAVLLTIRLIALTQAHKLCNSL